VRRTYIYSLKEERERREWNGGESPGPLAREEALSGYLCRAI